MRAIRTLSDVQIVLRELSTRLDTIEGKDWDRHGLKISNVGKGTNPDDVLIVSQLPPPPPPIQHNPQHFAIVFSTTGPVSVGTTISAPYVPGEYRTGIPIWVRIAMVIAPTGGNFTGNIQWKRKGGTYINILTQDIVIGPGQFGPVKSVNLINPVPFFDTDDSIIPTCTVASGASLVSYTIGVERRGPSLH